MSSAAFLASLLFLHAPAAPARSIAWNAPRAPSADGGLLAWWDAGIAQLRQHWLDRLRGGRHRFPLTPPSEQFGTDAPLPATAERFLWRGRWAAIATVRDDYDPLLVQRALDDLDRYWDRCRQLAGNSPPPPEPLARDLGFHLLLMESAAIGELAPPDASETGGRPGIAWVILERDALEGLLRAAAHGDRKRPLGTAVPQAVAETFFFFDPQLMLAAAEGSRAPASAFGFLLAGRAADALDWSLPPDPRPLESIADRFRADDTAWSDAPDGTTPSDIDVWTAILLRLHNASGRPDFVERLWRSTAECPVAATSDEAIANLIVATSGAAGSDATPRFAGWGFAIDEAIRTRVGEALAPRSLRVPRR